jgi:hypothetical protein
LLTDWLGFASQVAEPARVDPLAIEDATENPDGGGGGEDETTSHDEVAFTLLSPAVARTSTVCVPTFSPVYETGLEHLDQPPPSRRQSVRFAPVVVKEIDALVLVVWPGGLLVIVTVRELDASARPTVSVAITTSRAARTVRAAETRRLGKACG